MKTKLLSSLIKNKSQDKIFCIGFNKTGTTSLGLFFEQQGFKVARQRQGELLLNAYIERDFYKIMKFCSTSDYNVFQDVPFSLPYTYQHLATYFPKSKFILTVRKSADEWYESILKFHSDFYNNGNVPNHSILQNSTYVYQGWSWDLMNEVFFNKNNDIYDRNEFIKTYEDHNNAVINFFKNQKDRLIIVNLGKNQDYHKLCDFLNISNSENGFPRISSDDIVNKEYNCNFLK